MTIKILPRLGESRLLLLLLSIMISTPAFAVPTLSVGPFGSGISDGTAPFNELGNCNTATEIAEPGDDCGNQNRQVRVNDLVTYAWSVAVDNYTPGQENLKNVVFEQTLNPGANASITFEKIPAVCLPAGGGGSSPASAITENGDGTITLTCNLGEFEEGEQKSFSTPVFVKSGSWNGSTYTTSQRVYSLADDGTENAVGATSPDTVPITLSARPAYDLINANSNTSENLYGSYFQSRDVGFGLEPGLRYHSVIKIAVERKQGRETLVQPITFHDNFTIRTDSETGPIFPLEFYINSCTPQNMGFGLEVYGTGTSERHVTNSGSCTYNRDDPADPTSTAFTVTLNNIQLNTERFPTTTTTHAYDLSAGPYYVASYNVTIWIPLRALELTDGIADNNNGHVYMSSILSGFDPQSPSGVSNYGGNLEPGHDGQPMPDGSKSNNIVGPRHILLIPRGQFAKYASRQYRADNRYSAITGSSHPSDRDGLVQPEQSFVGWIVMNNVGAIPFGNPMLCDRFDNTTMRLATREDTGGWAAGSYPADSYAYVLGYNMNPIDYTIEYAQIDNSNDDPLDKNHDGIRDFNSLTGRYEGDWSQINAARCNTTPTSNGWHTNPSQVTGGVDGVNIVRARLSDASVLTNHPGLSPGESIRLIVPTTARDTFNGGPYDGELVPTGTVLPDYGSARSDNWNTNWITNWNRATLLRLSVELDSFTQQPATNPGESASTLSGNQIIWQVNTALTSTVEPTPTAENVQIIDVLPPYVSYNSACTVALPDGTPPNLIENNKDADGNTATGYTRLVWNLGDLVANTPIAPRVICTDTDPLAPDGTAVINYSEIRATSGVVTALENRSDTHTIVLEQAGNIQLSNQVDSTLDDLNDTQAYTLTWMNFSSSDTINEPTVINVFPYNGDGSAPSSARTPASDFTGTLTLTGAPSITWLDGSVPGGGDPHASLGTWYYTDDAPNSIDSDPDANTSNWCLESALGTGGCPATFADVTAIKFISNYSLAIDGDPRQGMMAQMTLQATGNTPDEHYTSRFALDSTTLPAAQFLRSNNVTVFTASYSVGDFLFADINSNGQFDADTDLPVPDGVTVNLHNAGDDSIVATTQTGLEKPGRYLFTKVGGGDHYITIPASEFQNGALLADWDITFTTADAEDETNESEDQDGYKTGDLLTEGIRTNVFNLSAQAPLPGELPKGNEPLSDNTAVLTDVTPDDYSNYTVDVGLLAPVDLGDAPADGSPAPDGSAVTAYGDAPHIVTPGFHLGMTNDIDTSTITSAEADAEGSEDDGIDWAALNLETSKTYRIDVNVTEAVAGTGYLQAWIDFNGDGQFDNSEQIATDVQDGAGGDKVAAQGIIGFHAQIPENAISPTFARLRWSGTTGLNATDTAANGEVEDSRVAFAPGGYQVSGRVYKDSNADGVNNDAEGIAKATVILFDTAAQTCVSTRTNAQGNYAFRGVQPGNYRVYEATNESVAIPQVCDPNTAGDPSGYLSTTSNTLAAFDMTDADVVDQNFGDAPQPAFSADNTRDILPGNVVFHAHAFTAPTTGSVRFTLAANAPDGWESVLYHDANCDGDLNGSEGNAALSSAVATTADASICILHKVFAPAHASRGQQSFVSLTADFTYGDGTTQASNQLRTNDDVTTASGNDSANTNDEGKLVLVKTVQNITQGTPETDTQNAAAPGNVLQYRLTYRNAGTAPLTDITLNDTVPEFTSLVTNSTVCGNTPASLSCLPDVQQATEIRWSFTGQLEAGAQGDVTYQITVE